MNYWGNRRPKGFSHTFLYVNERKELLEEIENRARRQLGMQARECNGHTHHLHEAFKPREGRRFMGGFRFGIQFFGLLLLAILAVLTACLFV